MSQKFKAFTHAMYRAENPNNSLNYGIDFPFTPDENIKIEKYIKCSGKYAILSKEIYQITGNTDMTSDSNYQVGCLVRLVNNTMLDEETEEISVCYENEKIAKFINFKKEFIKLYSR
jgi:hypothetical protein